ncbi:hypothetical protein GLOTRDRAFT_126397 [Gloeophyllum trabeum ATCC 11539]|uniref:Uncharacterized protein n=1 Tax=Gloeophyllum trabeum (strain ATCC 11539 / FP-39264 / Madison 617) TaxID=670483 RepID=S7RX28_GLOTA|nr:uncharacterized protein GLOTRDRAFT_126397 [Gloeophyllum trabeum ATCC 11539]EPQ57904.1 hypothetical protein GLOTRDRAFT_126397 [Gloeophyllum trabeum ATCC 11539]
MEAQETGPSVDVLTADSDITMDPLDPTKGWLYCRRCACTFWTKFGLEHIRSWKHSVARPHPGWAGAAPASPARLPPDLPPLRVPRPRVSLALFAPPEPPGPPVWTFQFYRPGRRRKWSLNPEEQPGRSGSIGPVRTSRSRSRYDPRQSSNRAPIRRRETSTLAREILETIEFPPYEEEGVEITPVPREIPLYEETDEEEEGPPVIKEELEDEQEMVLLRESDQADFSPSNVSTRDLTPLADA